MVERGKPHLVQDAAVQVFTAGRHLRSIVSAERQANDRVSSRHRRQSWHDLPEYHSVPYHQYTRAMHSGTEISVQCDLDRPYSSGQQETLLEMEEEVIEGDRMPLKERLRSSIEPSLPITGRVRVSTMTQTDDQLSRMFNLHLETNEILLSSLVNPFRRVTNSTLGIADDFGCHRSTSTGDDYPPDWSRVSTSFLLSNRAVEEKETRSSSPSPRFNSTDTGYQTCLSSSSTSLLERYERTVREREGIVADDVLRRYRERLSSSGTQTNLSVRELSLFVMSEGERSTSLSLSRPCPSPLSISILLLIPSFADLTPISNGSDVEQVSFNARHQQRRNASRLHSRSSGATRGLL